MYCFCALPLVSCPQAREQLPGEDATYKLAWNLDAAINQRRLTVRHMRELASIMAAHLEVRGAGGVFGICVRVCVHACG